MSLLKFSASTILFKDIPLEHIEAIHSGMTRTGQQTERKGATSQMPHEVDGACHDKQRDVIRYAMD